MNSSTDFLKKQWRYKMYNIKDMSMEDQNSICDLKKGELKFLLKAIVAESLTEYFSNLSSFAFDQIKQNKDNMFYYRKATNKVVSNLTEENRLAQIMDIVDRSKDSNKQKVS